MDLLQTLSEYNDYYFNWPRWLRQAAGIAETEEQVKESEFWGWLRDELTMGFPGIHIQRIESGSTASGIPDVNLCYKGIEAWIELKAAKLTQRSPVKGRFDLRADQASWLEKRSRAGGKAWVLVGVPNYDESEGRWGEMLLFQGTFALQLVSIPKDLSLQDLKDRAYLVLPKERGTCVRTLLAAVLGKESL